MIGIIFCRLVWKLFVRLQFRFDDRKRFVARGRRLSCSHIRNSSNNLILHLGAFINDVTQPEGMSRGWHFGKIHLGRWSENPHICVMSFMNDPSADPRNRFILYLTTLTQICLVAYFGPHFQKRNAKKNDHPQGGGAFSPPGPPP